MWSSDGVTASSVTDGGVPAEGGLFENFWSEAVDFAGSVASEALSRNLSKHVGTTNPQPYAITAQTPQSGQLQTPNAYTGGQYQSWANAQQASGQAHQAHQSHQQPSGGYQFQPWHAFAALASAAVLVAAFATRGG